MFDINNLQIHSNVSSTDLEDAINKLKQDNGLKGLGPAFLDAEKQYNINAVILAAIACLESAYGTSKLANDKNNLFGIDAPLSAVNTDKYGKQFTSKSICIDHAGHRLGKQYLELDSKASYRYCNNKDIYTIGEKWCEVPGWADKVVSIANRIKNNIIEDGGSMKINIHAGHGADDSKSCGAVGIIKESTEARKVKNEVIRLLKMQGHTVYDTTVDYPASKDDCLVQIVKKCNTNKVDLDISIHFNSGAKDSAGNGVTTGVEVFGYDTKQKSTGDRICSKIAAIGYKNRGFKTNANLYVLRNTDSQALLIECCFVDDKDDVNKYNYKTMAKAIAEGILNMSINESNKVKIQIDGKVYDTESKVIDGTTYVKLRDFTQAGYKVDYVNGIATIDKP